MRGEVVAILGGETVRLCVTLKALAQLETCFAVAGFEALGERLKRLSAHDLLVVLKALSLDDVAFETLAIDFRTALSAVIAAFMALHD